jgi:hypothetical protein
MEQIVLFSIPMTELQSLIAISVTESLEAHLPSLQPAAPPVEAYLSREETCDLLQISVMTLRQLELRGVLLGRRIGRRVLYLRSDVERALAPEGVQ